MGDPGTDLLPSLQPRFEEACRLLKLGGSDNLMPARGDGWTPSVPPHTCTSSAAPSALPPRPFALVHQSPPPRRCSHPGPGAARTATCSWPPRHCSTSTTFAGSCCRPRRPAALARSQLPMSRHHFPPSLPRLHHRSSSCRDPRGAADLTGARDCGLRNLLLQMPGPLHRQALRPPPAVRSLGKEGDPLMTSAGGEGR